MKLSVALLLSVFCLAFPLYPPETQDGAGGGSQEATENLNTVAGRQEALAARLQSAREMRDVNNLPQAAQLLIQAGYLQLKLNLPDEALATFQDSLNLANQLNDPVLKVDARNGVAAAYLHSSKYEDATPVVQEAIAISAQNNYARGRAEALLLLSDCQNSTNHSTALTTANEALTLWQTINDTDGIVRSHLKIATYQYAQNMLDEATQTNETARQLAKNGGFNYLEAEALINLSFIEYRKGAWSNVTKYLWDAGNLFDPQSDLLMMTRITGTIAEAYLESGQLEIALQKYEEALEYIRQSKRPRGVTVVKWSIGRTRFFAGQYSEALAKFEEALGEAQELKEPATVAMCHEFLGRTHEAMGHHTEALQNLETAFNLYSGAANAMEAARTQALIGQVYENSGQLARAGEFYQQALQSFDRHSDRVNQSATVFALGRLEMKSGNYDAAESHLHKAIELTENMRRMSTSRDLTAAFSATVHDRYEQYIQCLMRNHRDPASASRVTLAFETSELARARSLVELLRVTDTNLLSVDPALSIQESSVRQSLRVKEDDRVSLLRTKYEKKDLEKLDAELNRLNAEYRRILDVINERYPAFTQITQPQNWDLRRIQREVISDDETVLLEYLLGPEKSWVWAVTHNSITSYDLPPQAEITDAVKKVYELLKEKPKPETKAVLDQATQKLSQMILSPLSDQLSKRRIIVAADGALNYIPFQILPVAANAEPSVAQHEIINTPSASIQGELLREAADRGVRRKVLAAFGNPKFAEQEQSKETAETRNIEIKAESFDPSSVRRLFFAGREIANLRAVASDEQTFAATDYDATRDKLLNTDLTQYAVLHFATHGYLDPNHPEKSGLLLATTNPDGKKLNGFVGLQDVYSLRAPVDLVVLSACETGLGKDIRGEGLIGLTRGFMYAGATSVVASLWKVEDEATAELMKSFYTEMLKNGKTPAEALRSAQNSIRQNPQHPQWSAPHYWAGFTLQGEYRYAVNSSHGWKTYQIVLLAAAVVLLSGFGGFVWRRRYFASKK